MINKNDIKKQNKVVTYLSKISSNYGQCNDDDQLESKFNESVLELVLNIQTCGKSLKTNILQNGV